MAWQTVRLGDVCELKYGKNLPKQSRVPGDINVYGSNGIVDTHCQSLIHAPALVIGRKGSIGKIHYQKQGALWPIDTTYYVDETMVDTSLDWLYYLFLSLDFSQMNKAAAIPGLNRNDVYELKISLPPLPEQQRIATLLEKVDHLRQLRQKSLCRLDDLVQATFLEIFGDPVMNPKGWKTDLLSQVAWVRSGVTKGRKLAPEEVISVPYMRVANVQDGYLSLDEIKNILVLPSDVEKYSLQLGDLLLTEGGDIDKLGRGAIWGNQIESCIHQNHIFCVRLKTKELRPEYLSALVGSAYGKRYFLKQAKQTTGIASINSTQLKAFPVQKPSLSLQLTYEDAIKQINTQKHHHQIALSQLDTLFNSLMQQAFTGQLKWRDDNHTPQQLSLPFEVAS